MELKALMFKTLYGWIVTLQSLNGSHFSNFQEFEDLCSSSSPQLDVLLVYSLCTWVAPSNKIELFFFKKKKLYIKADFIVLITSEVLSPFMVLFKICQEFILYQISNAFT